MRTSRPRPVLSLLSVVSVALALLACSKPSLQSPPTVSDAAGLSIDQLLSHELGGAGGSLVSLAQQQLGRPYRYGGTTPKGFDCSGLVYFVYRQAGYQVPRSSREQYRSARKISLASISPGDLVFFEVSTGKVSHVGIYVSDDLFIHSPSSGKGVSYASLQDDYWETRLIGVGRLH